MKVHKKGTGMFPKQTHKIFVWEVTFFYHFGSVSPLLQYSEAYLEPCQISKMKCFVKIFKGFQPLTIFTKHFILGIWQCSDASYILLAIEIKEGIDAKGVW